MIQPSKCIWHFIIRCFVQTSHTWPLRAFMGPYPSRAVSSGCTPLRGPGLTHAGHTILVLFVGPLQCPMPGPAILGHPEGHPRAPRIPRASQASRSHPPHKADAQVQRSSKPASQPAWPASQQAQPASQPAQLSSSEKAKTQFSHPAQTGAGSVKSYIPVSPAASPYTSPDRDGPLKS